MYLQILPQTIVVLTHVHSSFFFMVACEFGPLLMGQFCQLSSAWKNKCSCLEKEYLMNMFSALACINWANSNVSDTSRCGIASKCMDLSHKHLTHQVCLECLQQVQCSALLLSLPVRQCARRKLVILWQANKNQSIKLLKAVNTVRT